ncbi:MAG TPA: hypothetical protein VJM69_01320, partial [Dehalococcoidia bacterium]|nr:hypothetical protein [Dehalococcoidia bacterium]
EGADDPDLECSAVGEGTDASFTEPDNFDCTRHTLSTPPPPPTRTIFLVFGWNLITWTGASTPPSPQNTCAGVANWDVSFRWRNDLQSWEFEINGNEAASTMTNLAKYDPFWIHVTNAGGASCTMPT